jgi:outer membrane lipoprotein-sorting protein
VTTILVAALVALLAPGVVTTRQPDAREVMERNFRVTKVSALEFDATMVLTNEKGQTRERRMTTVVKLQPNGVDSRFLVRFSTPADIRGTGFLQVEHADGDDDLWIYLPALKKSRRLVANNKKDSFVGSDFSYGDIALPKVDLYRHVMKGREQVDGVDCYVIESTPRDDAVRASSGYSRKVTWVRSDNFLEAKVEYHDLSGQLLKTQLVKRPELVEAGRGTWFARHREMTNHRTGHRTTFTVDRIEPKARLADDMFSTRFMERP